MSSSQENISRSHLLTGSEGEEVAVRFLIKQGYKIITRNFRTRLGEVDIVAREEKTLVFVEVKTRTGKQFGSPLFAVDQRKQAKITRVALLYLSNKKLNACPCRFDVVAIQKHFGSYQVRLVRNAFEMAL